MDGWEDMGPLAFCFLCSIQAIRKPFGPQPFRSFVDKNPKKRWVWSAPPINALVVKFGRGGRLPQSTSSLPSLGLKKETVPLFYLPTGGPRKEKKPNPLSPPPPPRRLLHRSRSRKATGGRAEPVAAEAKSVEGCARAGGGGAGWAGGVGWGGVGWGGVGWGGVGWGGVGWGGVGWGGVGWGGVGWGGVGWGGVGSVNYLLSQFRSIPRFANSLVHIFLSGFIHQVARCSELSEIQRVAT